MAQIAEILPQQRLIQPVGVLEVGAHRGAERLLLVEWSPGSETQDKEGDRDDDEQRRNKSGHAPHDVAQHGGDFREAVRNSSTPRPVPATPPGRPRYTGPPIARLAGRLPR